MKKKPRDSNGQFGKDIKKGLSAFPKYLDSKYIYDEKGDKLFQQIMDMPEYYLTKCEYEILESHKKPITENLKVSEGFDLVELGAGDAKKTKILLKYWTEQGMDLEYIPIDISQHTLDALKKSLTYEFPQLEVTLKQESYFEALAHISSISTRKKVILVLGSNIGNLPHSRAIDFLASIQKAMNEEDMLFMGFDQKKSPEIILDAYNDKAGITEAFNKNLLVRINKEMQANFEPDEFIHWPLYDPESGTAKSYLVSKKTQNVGIEKLELEVHFKKHESLLMEISQKYDDSIVSWLADKAGLKVLQNFSDSRDYYKNYIFVSK